MLKNEDNTVDNRPFVQDLKDSAPRHETVTLEPELPTWLSNPVIHTFPDTTVGFFTKSKDEKWEFKRYQTRPLKLLETTPLRSELNDRIWDRKSCLPVLIKGKLYFITDRHDLWYNSLVLIDSNRNILAESRNTQGNTYMFEHAIADPVNRLVWHRTAPQPTFYFLINPDTLGCVSFSINEQGNDASIDLVCQQRIYGEAYHETDFVSRLRPYTDETFLVLRNEHRTIEFNMKYKTIDKDHRPVNDVIKVSPTRYWITTEINRAHLLPGVDAEHKSDNEGIELEHNTKNMYSRTGLSNCSGIFGYDRTHIAFRHLSFFDTVKSKLQTVRPLTNPVSSPSMSSSFFSPTMTSCGDIAYLYNKQGYVNGEYAHHANELCLFRLDTNERYNQFKMSMVIFSKFSQLLPLISKLPLPVSKIVMEYFLSPLVKQHIEIFNEITEKNISHLYLLIADEDLFGPTSDENIMIRNMRQAFHLESKAADHSNLLTRLKDNLRNPHMLAPTRSIFGKAKTPVVNEQTVLLKSILTSISDFSDLETCPEFYKLKHLYGKPLVDVVDRIDTLKA